LLLGLSTVVLVACWGEHIVFVPMEAASAGPAGAAGSGGKGGSSGSGGSGGTAGSVAADASSDAQANPDAIDAPANTDAPPPDVVTADVPRDTAQESSSDVASDSHGPDVVVVEAAADVLTPAEVGPASCPAMQPASDSDCPQNGLLCDYADAGGLPCICRTISAGVRHWSCFGLDASAPNCPPPPMKPMTGQVCSDAGASYACRYGNSWCFCNVAGGAANSWQCI